MISIAFLIIAGLIALLITACGGLVTVQALASMGTRRSSIEVLVISLPFLAIGGAGLISCVLRMRKLVATAPAAPSLKEEQE